MQHAIIKNWRGIRAAALIVVAPLNLFWQVPIATAYVAGLRIDYLVPKLYLSWLFALVALSTTRLIVPRKLAQIIINNWLVIALSMSVFVRQLFTEKPISGVIQFVWILTAVLLVHSLSTMRTTKRVMGWGSAIALSMQLILGWWQLVMQRSFAAYHWFGESNLSSWYGIAKGVWFDREITLPYGTTAHPNILANTLAVLWWLTWLGFKKHMLHDKKTNGPLLRVGWFIYSLTCMTLIISTQSITGILAAGIAVLLAVTTLKYPSIAKVVVQKIGWLAITIICIVPLWMWLLQPLSFGLTQQLSWTRRTVLFEQAITVIRQQPIFGTGLAQSTIFFSRVGGASEIVRFVQPVHNLFWLWLTETGVIGVILAILLGRKLTSKIPASMSIESLGWLMLVPAATLDHFWLTQWPGMLLISILFSISHKKN